MRRSLARLLIKLAARLLASLPDDCEAARKKYITDTARLAGWPREAARETAAVLVAHGVTRHEADVMFREAIARPPC